MPVSQRSSEGAHMAVLGAGRVGATTAYASLIRGIVDTLTLVDVDLARAEGEAMDLSHGLPFLQQAQIRASTPADCAGADLLVLTAGAARQPGDSRLDLAKRNLELMRGLVPQVQARNPGAIWIVVSNPVDLLTRAVREFAGCPAGRVIGTGTMLDTARMRALLAQHFEVDAHNVHAAIIGEHGDTEVPVWSLARIANLDLPSFARAVGRPWDAAIQAQFGNQVRSAGAEVIRRKGATYYAIGLATAQLARAILRDERSILTVASVLDGEQGLRDVALSLPCLLGRSGRLNTIPLSLDEGEQSALARSADVLRKAYQEAGGTSSPPSVSPA
jgi:L-lactate dehydrogenase